MYALAKKLGLTWDQFIQLLNASDTCPQCEARWTAPIRCDGYYNPDNTGKYYQQCSKKDFNLSGCPSFRWCSPQHLITYDLTGSPKCGRPLGNACPTPPLTPSRSQRQTPKSKGSLSRSLTPPPTPSRPQRIDPAVQRTIYVQLANLDASHNGQPIRVTISASQWPVLYPHKHSRLRQVLNVQSASDAYQHKLGPHFHTTRRGVTTCVEVIDID
ncbi:hypothetical protein BDZ89DRAFT_1143454 [Hymenopellis radicata]|nr:hypothetical protein BDZ89DRAFT_1143454 [Hymenopellis radicata]